MTTTEPRPHESQEDREVATAGRLRAIAATQQSPDRHGIQPADVDSRAGARPIAPPQLAAPRSPPSRAIAQQRAARPALPGRKFASLGCTRANALISAAEDASTITALERICARARSCVRIPTIPPRSYHALGEDEPAGTTYGGGSSASARGRGESRDARTPRPPARRPP
jgi:hypothetical protein